MKIGCILVLYNPHFSLTRKVIDNVIDQVDLIYIVDNSTNGYDSNLLVIPSEKVKYNKLNKNVGIATAQNIALEYLINQQYTYAFFLDQDSIIENNFVCTLLNGLYKIEKLGILVGAVGPRPINNRNKKKYVGSIIKGKKIFDQIIEVPALINSGSLIPIENFKVNGMMDDELFIDGVDHEWCWRSMHKSKLRFFICENVKLYHHLGEKDLFFIYRNISITSPFRIYYQYRNFMILVRREYVPLYWKLSNGVKYFIKLFYYPLFIHPHLLYLRQIIRGIKDGIFLKKSK